MTDGLRLTHGPIRDEILLHLDLWRRGKKGCVAKSVIMHTFNRTRGEIETYEIHNNEWSVFIIMHNYAFKSRYPHTHPSQDWRSTVCTDLPPTQIECQPECQTMRDGSSSCQYLERNFHRCVLTEQSLVLKPLCSHKHSTNSPRRAEVCFHISPPSVGWEEKLRRSYCVGKDGG